MIGINWVKFVQSCLDNPAWIQNDQIILDIYFSYLTYHFNMEH